MTQYYLDFLRYSLNDSLPLPESVKGIDWMEMMAWAEQQAIVGVIYGGMLRAGKALGVPFDVLMECNCSVNRNCSVNPVIAI